MVPKSVRAVILLFPLTADFKQEREARYAEKLGQLGKGHMDPEVVWIKQTVRQGVVLPRSLHNIRIHADSPIVSLLLEQIGNACGTMAMLHALLNAVGSTTRKPSKLPAADCASSRQTCFNPIVPYLDSRRSANVGTFHFFHSEDG